MRVDQRGRSGASRSAANSRSKSASGSSARAGVAYGKREAPDLVALFLAEVAEVLGEAGEQVGLGDQHVDRRAHAELGVQLLQARAQLRGMLLALGRRLLQQVLRR